MNTCIPVADAAEISVKRDKRVVVVAAIDFDGDCIHTASFGRSPAEKLYSASIADDLLSLMNASPISSFADFRYADQAKQQEKISELLIAARGAALACESVMALSRPGAERNMIRQVFADLEAAIKLGEQP